MITIIPYRPNNNDNNTARDYNCKLWFTCFSICITQVIVESSAAWAECRYSSQPAMTSRRNRSRNLASQSTRYSTGRQQLIMCRTTRNVQCNLPLRTTMRLHRQLTVSMGYSDMTKNAVSLEWGSITRTKTRKTSMTESQPTWKENGKAALSAVHCCWHKQPPRSNVVISVTLLNCAPSANSSSHSTSVSCVTTSAITLRRCSRASSPFHPHCRNRHRVAVCQGSTTVLMRVYGLHGVDTIKARSRRHRCLLVSSLVQRNPLPVPWTGPPSITSNFRWGSQKTLDLAQRSHERQPSAPAAAMRHAASAQLSTTAITATQRSGHPSTTSVFFCWLLLSWWIEIEITFDNRCFERKKTRNHKQTFIESAVRCFESYSCTSCWNRK